jgi:hypothetical protein
MFGCIYPIQSLAGVVDAIERHRHQMARLLDGLDDLDRATVSDGAPALAEGRADIRRLSTWRTGRRADRRASGSR